MSLEVLKHWKTVYEAYVVSVGKKEEFINWLNTNVTETQLELLTECSLKNPSLDALKVWIRWMPNVTQEDLSLAKSCDLENVKSPKELSAWLDDKKAAALAEAAATTEP